MQIFFKFDKELEGINSYSALIHTKEGKEYQKWNNWNFTETSFWDGEPGANFWYSENTTILLFT